jgi:RNA polymerase sigma factor (sigma-70 family)
VTGVRAIHDLQTVLAGLADGLEIAATRRLGNRDDARDAAQETISRLMERVNGRGVRTPEELGPIAWGIARHVIADMLRERGRKIESLVEHPCAAPGPLDALVSAEDADRVRRALDRLSVEDRSVLQRCFVNNERIGQIAEALGEPPERLRKRKSRALQRLACLLGAERGDSSHESEAKPMESL